MWKRIVANALSPIATVEYGHAAARPVNPGLFEGGWNQRTGHVSCISVGCPALQLVGSLGLGDRIEPLGPPVQVEFLPYLPPQHCMPSIHLSVSPSI